MRIPDRSAILTWAFSSPCFIVHLLGNLFRQTRISTSAAAPLQDPIRVLTGNDGLGQGAALHQSLLAMMVLRRHRAPKLNGP